MHRNNSMPQDRLATAHFFYALLVAGLLHLSGFVVWKFTPKQELRELPIRLLNIRLGDGEELALESPQSPHSPTNPAQVEAMLQQAAESMAAPKEEPLQAAKHYVREMPTPRTKKAGVRDGKRDAEIMSRYTQLISLWIQKFKLYPEEARANGWKGSTVVRIRIDRRGNVHYTALERSTGIPILDQAALDMIRRANPVPAVPSDYPAGESFEFLIPVNFSLI